MVVIASTAKQCHVFIACLGRPHGQELRPVELKAPGVLNWVSGLVTILCLNENQKFFPSSR